ncbi:MAG TPA: SIS domain-containing protein [Actinomycetota bacterium]|nr:SIS domain-containing protein [Actinomycetota bacterium]
MKPGNVLPTGRLHLAALRQALRQLSGEIERVDEWAQDLCAALEAGGKLLAVGNGGSASEAQHLAAELVGRFRDDRPALSALALLPDTACLTALCNDYGVEEMFARQVRAHGRPGDILVTISTSGASPNVLAAARQARKMSIKTWALTGRRPNPLADICDDCICVDSTSTATVQEAHLILIHLLCAALDCRLGVSSPLESVEADH